MKAPVPQVSLYVPGLLPPPKGLCELPEGIPEAPALATLLRRSSHREDRQVEADYAGLAACFGLVGQAQQDLPLAACSYLADTGNRAGDWVARADPVHLRADQADLILYDRAALSWTEDELKQLAKAFNTTFADDGLRLELALPDRAYLHCADPGDLHTTSLPQARGRSIDTLLPDGADASRWHALLTEVQMLLHGLPFNQQRADERQPALNSLWLWGGGRTPGDLQFDHDVVVSSDPVAGGLAMLAGADWLRDTDQALERIDRAEHLGRLLWFAPDLQPAQAYHEPERWASIVRAWEAECVAPLLQRLRAGTLQQIRLYTGTAEWRLDRAHLRRFWQRVPPLKRMLCHAD